MKRIVCRSYSRDFKKTTEDLNEKLAEGYNIVMVTPYMKDGATEYLEYILEKDDSEDTYNKLDDTIDRLNKEIDNLKWFIRFEKDMKEKGV